MRSSAERCRCSDRMCRLGIMQARWFVLSGRQLCYYEDPLHTKARRTADLAGCEVRQVAAGHDAEFPELLFWTIQAVGKEGLHWRLAARNADDRVRWIAALRAACGAPTPELCPLSSVPLGGADLPPLSSLPPPGAGAETTGAAQRHGMTHEDGGSADSHVDSDDNRSGHTEGWLLRAARQGSCYGSLSKRWMVLSGQHLESFWDPNDPTSLDTTDIRGCVVDVLDDSCCEHAAVKELLSRHQQPAAAWFALRHAQVEIDVIFVCTGHADRTRWVDALRCCARSDSADQAGSLHRRALGLAGQVAAGATHPAPAAGTRPPAPIQEALASHLDYGLRWEGLEESANEAVKRFLSLRGRCEKLGGGGRDGWIDWVAGLVPDGSAACAGLVEVDLPAELVAHMLYDLHAAVHLDERCLGVRQLAHDQGAARSVRDYRFASPVPWATRQFRLIVSRHKLPTAGLTRSRNASGVGVKQTGISSVLGSPAKNLAGAVAGGAAPLGHALSQPSSLTLRPLASTSSCASVDNAAYLVAAMSVDLQGPAAGFVEAGDSTQRDADFDFGAVIPAQLLSAGYLIEPLPLPPVAETDVAGAHGAAGGEERKAAVPRRRCAVRCVAVVSATGLGHRLGAVGPPWARPECLPKVKAYLENPANLPHADVLASLLDASARSSLDRPLTANTGAALCGALDDMRLGVGGYGSGGRVCGKKGEVALRTLSCNRGAEEEPGELNMGSAKTPIFAAGFERMMTQRGITMAGWMYKRRMLVPGTRKRWFEVRKHMLLYYLEPHNKSARGVFDLRGCFVAVRDRGQGSRMERLLGLYLIVLHVSTSRWPITLGLASRRAALHWAQVFVDASQRRSQVTPAPDTPGASIQTVVIGASPLAAPFS